MATLNARELRRLSELLARLYEERIVYLAPDEQNAITTARRVAEDLLDAREDEARRPS